MPTLKFTIESTDESSTPFAGKWEAFFPNAPVMYVFDLKLKGSDVSGTLASGSRTVPIYDGRLDAVTMSFKLKSPDGDRTVTFTGKLNDNEITFTREVEVRPGGAPGSAALFGASGVRTFIAKRVDE